MDKQTATLAALAVVCLTLIAVYCGEGSNAISAIAGMITGGVAIQGSDLSPGRIKSQAEKTLTSGLFRQNKPVVLRFSIPCYGYEAWVQTTQRQRQ